MAQAPNDENAQQKEMDKKGECTKKEDGDEVADYYKNLKLPLSEKVALPRDEDLTDRDNALRVVSNIIRKQLKEKNLPISPVGGEAINLGNAKEDSKHWSMNFPLLYRAVTPDGTIHLIPLDRACGVQCLFKSGNDNMTVTWSNIPTLKQLPTGQDLESNVTKEQAESVATDDFLKRVKPAGVKKDDIDVKSQKMILCVGDLPCRLTWNVLVKIKDGVEIPVHMLRQTPSETQYDVDAQMNKGKHIPDIITFSLSPHCELRVPSR
jgi:hypothetical protein